LKHPDLRVNVGNQLQCMLGNKPRPLSIQPGGSVPVFRKNGTGIVLNWPQGSNGARWSERNNVFYSAHSWKQAETFSVLRDQYIRSHTCWIL